MAQQVISHDARVDELPAAIEAQASAFLALQARAAAADRRTSRPTSRAITAGRGPAVNPAQQRACS